MLAMIFLGDLSNFFIPAYPLIPCLAALTGLTFLILHRRWLFTGLTPANILSALIVLAVASLAATRPSTHVDTGLYHLQAVRWITDRSLVPGLANLHLRLGYNSAWAMVAAVMEAPGLLGKSMFLLNTLLATIAICLSLDSLRQVLTTGITLSTGLLALLICPVADMAISRGPTPPWASSVPSLGNDMASMILVVIVLSLILRKRESTPITDLTVSIHSLVLAVLATIVKVSCAPILAGAGILFLYRLAHTKAWRTATIPILISALAIGAWMARGIGLSGCPLYPSPIARLPVKWAVPPQDALRDLSWIRSWARGNPDSPTQVLANWNWLIPWYHRLDKNHFRIPALLAFALLGLAAVAWGTIRSKHPRLPIETWIALATAAAGVLYWFIMAPDPRFGLGFIFSLWILSILTGAQAIGLPLHSNIARAIIAFIVIVTLCTGPSLLKQIPHNALFQIPRVPEVPVTLVKTPQGLGIYLPTTGHRAWRAPLPSAWKISPALRASVDSAGRPTMFWSDPSPHQSPSELSSPQ
jgi:hypothetical protein